MTNHPVDLDLAVRIVGLLNELYALDPHAVHALVEHRVPCSQTVADHPTVQVLGHRSAVLSESVDRVGMLGILNGLCGIYDDGHGPIVSLYNADGRLLGFDSVYKQPTLKRPGDHLFVDGLCYCGQRRDDPPRMCTHYKSGE